MIEDSEIGSPPTSDAGATAPAARTEASTHGPSSSGSAARHPPAGSSDTMSVTFKLYATLQDLLPAGAVKNAVGIEIPTDATLNDVIDRYRVPRELAHLVLVNGVFVCDADRDAPGALAPGDVLAIWPPVAGG